MWVRALPKFGNTKIELSQKYFKGALGPSFPKSQDENNTQKSRGDQIGLA
jgi:hypothetical protein